VLLLNVSKKLQKWTRLRALRCHHLLLVNPGRMIIDDPMFLSSIYYLCFEILVTGYFISREYFSSGWNQNSICA
jgi:hypothetical protein